MSTGSIAALVDLYGSPGADELYDEEVTELAHALQCAELAEADGAGPELVAASLLHDVGHLLVEHDHDHHHERLGAQLLARWFPPQVAGPVGLHVAAKRYLCGTEAGYHADLSTSSVASLREQGGPMDRDEAASFEQNVHARAAILLRRYDDRAKVCGTATRPFSDFVPLLERLLV